MNQTDRSENIFRKENSLEAEPFPSTSDLYESIKSGTTPSKIAVSELENEVPRVDTSRHFDTKWGRVYETERSSEDYELRVNLPEVSEEMLIHVHGWRNSASDGVERIDSMREAYREEGFEGFVTGLTWDSTQSWWNSKEIADRNAPKLANFIEDYRDNSPETDIRLQGHSMGSRVVAETLKELEEPVESVTFLGGAIRDYEVSMEGRYGEILDEKAGTVDNYWDADDRTLNFLYMGPFYDAIGNNGCDGTQPDNYTDHEVNVGGHGGYYEKGNEAIRNFVNSLD